MGNLSVATGWTPVQVYYPSATLRNSNDGSKGDNELDYVKIKEVKLNASIDGFRLGFTLTRTGAGVGTVYAKIYKNGVAIGTERSTGGATSPTEDFTAGYAANDLIQIYGKVTDVLNESTVTNMRFYYDSHVTTIGGFTLTTALELTISAISMTNQDP